MIEPYPDKGIAALYVHTPAPVLSAIDDADSLSLRLVFRYGGYDVEEQVHQQPPTGALDPEIRIAWKLAFLVLLTLTLVKPLGSIAWVGPIAFTFAAGLQLWLPIHRMDKLKLDYDFVGLHRDHLREDFRLVGWLCLLTFVPYAIGHHFYMTEARLLAYDLGFDAIGRYLPLRQLSPSLPSDFEAWLSASWWLLNLTATHILGVALPEETFYRGYLQPQLEKRWPPQTRVFGALMGRAVIVSSALFALGHFLGEWNPLRLGPFIPSLLFAWLRCRTGSIWGAIGFHAACNIFGQLLFQLYAPI